MSRVGQKVKMTSLDELLCVPTIEGTNDIEIALIKQFNGKSKHNICQKLLRE